MCQRAMEKLNYIYAADNYANGKGGGRKEERCVE
jgi:hypothetical protein